MVHRQRVPVQCVLDSNSRKHQSTQGEENILDYYEQTVTTIKGNGILGSIHLPKTLEMRYLHSLL